MERYICIHGHFYQPPRENPWLEAIEIQDSAYPYHDWNERISAECYGPNGAARMLNGNRIERIVNNYARISFNFGPTLLQWIEQFRPDVYRAILAADRESRELYSGHGSAMAQAHNHMILPLANRRDKHTQIYWGIRDFRHRFGRDPEGMWLPETAVDMESLNVMAEFGIRFTVLSPYQASRVRPVGTRPWHDVTGGRVDPSTPYLVHLRSGRTITVFFYDGPISRAVAFEDLLVKGEYLAERLNGAFSDQRTWPQLVHIATDGETYGHHRKAGEMGLAYALHYIETQQIARLTNYGEFLDKHPPTHEAQILEDTSWSCAHGVERWRGDCGCASGGRAGWNQQWRGPLRAAHYWHRDTVSPAFHEHARKYLKDPWEARDEYIQLVLDRSPESIERYFAQQQRRALDQDERVRALKLLELQRHCMLMYTSCGWFFDEISGLEAVQVLQYAGRVLQLARDVLGKDLEPEFLTRLAEARSNLPEHGDGRQIYDKFVRPAMVDLHKVGAHYSVSSLFEDYPDRARVFCYDVDRHDSRSLAAGKVKLAHGRVTVHSAITLESSSMSFGILHLGEHTIAGGVRDLPTDESYIEFQQQIASKFERGDLPDVLHDVFERFGAGAYSLKLLFRDAQRRILDRILDSSLTRANASYRHIYETDAPLMSFLRSLQIPLPNGFRMAAEFVLNSDLRTALQESPPDAYRVRSLLEEVARIGIALDQPTLEFALRGSIEALATQLGSQPRALERVALLNGAVRLARSLPFPVDLWTAQNIVHEIKLDVYPEMLLCADEGERQAGEWVTAVRELADNLSLRMD